MSILDKITEKQKAASELRFREKAVSGLYGMFARQSQPVATPYQIQANPSRLAGYEEGMAARAAATQNYINEDKGRQL